MVGRGSGRGLTVPLVAVLGLPSDSSGDSSGASSGAVPSGDLARQPHGVSSYSLYTQDPPSSANTSFLYSSVNCKIHLDTWLWFLKEKATKQQLSSGSGAGLSYNMWHCDSLGESPGKLLESSLSKVLH